MTGSEKSTGEQAPGPGLVGRLERALLPKLPPVNLAICRIVTGAWVLYFFSEHQRGFIRSCTKPSAEHFRPVGLVALLFEQPMQAESFELLVNLTVFFGFAFVLGFLHRYTGPIFGLLLLFIFTYRQSWGFIFHTENSLVLSSLVLGLSPAADTWSIDALLVAKVPRWRRFLVGPAHEAVTDPENHATRRGTPDYRYGWPIQLIILIVGICYAIAGAAKIGAVGWSWADGETLRGQILQNAIWYEFISGKPPEHTLAVIALPMWIFVFLSWFTLVAELGGPLVVLNRRLVPLYALIMFGFHWGVKITMGIPFIYHLYGAAFVAFIPWERIIRPRKEPASSPDD